MISFNFNLLQPRFGGGGSSGANPVMALRLAEANQTKSIAATARRPEIAREVAAFRAAVARAPDVETLLKDPRALKVLLTANGLGDQAQYTALAKKALMSDPDDPASLANRLGDRRWKVVAETLDFSASGLAVLRKPEVLDRLADSYAEIAWRRSLDETTPGLSDALTFREQAKDIGSATEILGNSVLRRVVTTTLGLPPQIAFQSLETQERAITSRLDISRLQDKSFVDKFTHRYLLAAASANQAASGGTGDLFGLVGRARGLVV